MENNYSNQFDEYVFSLTKYQFETQFKKELNSCIRNYNLKALNEQSIFLKNFYHESCFNLKKIFSASLNNSKLRLSIKKYVNNDLITGEIICWSQVYFKENELFIETQNTDLLFKALNLADKLKFNFKINFIELDDFGFKTSFEEYF